MSPRKYLADPARFGRTGVVWSPTESMQEAAACRAAMVQHEAARYVRLYLDVNHTTQGQLARALGWRRERLARMVIGQVWAPLPDLEVLLAGCGLSLMSVLFSASPTAEGTGPTRQIIARYLRDQLRELEASSAG